MARHVSKPIGVTSVCGCYGDIHARVGRDQGCAVADASGRVASLSAVRSGVVVGAGGAGELKNVG